MKERLLARGSAACRARLGARSVESCGCPSIRFGPCTRPTICGWTRWRATREVSANHYGSSCVCCCCPLTRLLARDPPSASYYARNTRIHEGEIIGDGHGRDRCSIVILRSQHDAGTENKAPEPAAFTCAPTRAAPLRLAPAAKPMPSGALIPVSYTHLTLPTICSV
eukprot:3230850-Prymnesium_polylepis.1